jgi:hypothetical protein
LNPYASGLDPVLAQVDRARHLLQLAVERATQLGARERVSGDGHDADADRAAAYQPQHQLGAD